MGWIKGLLAWSWECCRSNSLLLVLWPQNKTSGGDQYLSHPHVQQLWLIEATAEDSTAVVPKQGCSTILSTEQ